MKDKINEAPIEAKKAPFPEPIHVVLDALAKLRFGAIQLTIHDGNLVQVDVTERQRFNY